MTLAFGDLPDADRTALLLEDTIALGQRLHGQEYWLDDLIDPIVARESDTYAVADELLTRMTS